MTRFTVSLWRESHEKSPCGKHTNIVFKPFSDRLISPFIVEAKNAEELETCVLEIVNSNKDTAAILAVQEYGETAHVSTSVSVTKHLAGPNRRFSGCDFAIRQVQAKAKFNAFEHVEAKKKSRLNFPPMAEQRTPDQLIRGLFLPEPEKSSKILPERFCPWG